MQQKIGVQQAIDNQIRMDPKAQERMANATPEQRAMGAKITTVVTEVAFLGGPVIAMGVVAVFSLVLMATINFGFGGKAKFGSIFAVCYYAWLPWRFFRGDSLGTVVVFFMAPESSANIKNFAPTNLGVLFDPGGHEQSAIHARELGGWNYDRASGVAQHRRRHRSRNQAELRLHRSVWMVDSVASGRCRYCGDDELRRVSASALLQVGLKRTLAGWQARNGAIPSYDSSQYVEFQDGHPLLAFSCWIYGSAIPGPQVRGISTPRTWGTQECAEWLELALLQSNLLLTAYVDAG